MNTGVRTVSYFIVGLVGVVLFMIGGNIVIWAFHFLLWNPPSDFVSYLPSAIAGFYPIATPLGLFLIGFGVLLIFWSGVGLFFHSQAVLTQRD